MAYQIEGTFQIAPGSAYYQILHSNPKHLQQLEEWLRSYKPEELFDEKGAVYLKKNWQTLAPDLGEKRMGANPHANGGAALHDLLMPDFCDYAL